ncbi:MAG: hypothetical protein V3T77_03800, partial [Planctomycetota bacterium]
MSFCPVRRVLKLLAVLLWAVPAYAIEVPPGPGIQFRQLSFTWEQATTLSSNVGRVVVDIAAVRELTGIENGYLNIGTPLGWVVQNLPIQSIEFPYPFIASHFKLADSRDPGPITELEALIDFATLPSSHFTGDIFITYPVVAGEYDGEGKDFPVTLISPNPPPQIAGFIAGGITESLFPPPYPNVEAAQRQGGPAAAANSLDQRQGGPAAAANSLDWLRTTYGPVLFPHAHVPG